MDFPQRLKALMERGKITKFKLSKRLDVSPSTVANWLNGESKPNIKCIRALADYFGVSTDYLLTGELSEETTYASAGSAVEQLAQILLETFQKVSVSDKIAIVQYAESLLHSNALYDEMAGNEKDGGHTLSEPFGARYDGLTAEEARRVRALLKLHGGKD